MDDQIENEEIQESKPGKDRLKSAFMHAKKLFLHKILHFRYRKLIPIVCFLMVFGIVISLMALTVSAAVCQKAKDRILSQSKLENLEMNFDAVMVLGCKVFDDGTPSDRLKDRLTVGISIFKTGICDKILMSGDSEYADYDEVGAMKREALAAGITEEEILLDPYGLSTYESLIRFRDEFGGKRLVIVTQEYHLYRALYIAEKLGIEAYGVHADLQPYQKQMQMELREILARCKDVFFSLLQPAPKW